MRIIFIQLAIVLFILWVGHMLTYEGPTELRFDMAAGIDPEKQFPPDELRRLRALNLLPPSGRFYGYRGGDDDGEPDLGNLRPAAAGGAARGSATTRNAHPADRHEPQAGGARACHAGRVEGACADE